MPLDPYLVCDTGPSKTYETLIWNPDMSIILDPTDPGRLRHPTPTLGHRNYPMYTSGGFDRRWVDGFELGCSDVKWVGNMMCDIPPQICRRVKLTCISF